MSLKAQRTESKIFLSKRMKQLCDEPDEALLHAALAQYFHRQNIKGHYYD
jgi:hypothetical protein